MFMFLAVWQLRFVTIHAVDAINALSVCVFMSPNRDLRATINPPSCILLMALWQHLCGLEKFLKSTVTGLTVSLCWWLYQSTTVCLILLSWDFRSLVRSNYRRNRAWVHTKHTGSLHGLVYFLVFVLVICGWQKRQKTRAVKEEAHLLSLHPSSGRPLLCFIISARRFLCSRPNWRHLLLFTHCR